MKVIVQGARRHKQGLGEFLAYWFSRSGAEVCAVTGTSDATVSEALSNLEATHGISCRGYTSLEEALEKETPDVAVLCSPFKFHKESLKTVAEAGVNCLCEKPLWWDDSCSDIRSETENIIDAFITRGLYLAIQTQWPCTLPFFYEIYPEEKSREVETFEMTLGPISIGPEMVLDSAPHILSMLHKLAGAGTVLNPAIECMDESGSKIRLSFEFKHKNGVIETACNFIRTEKPPRPAGYSINGKEVKRIVQFPDYDTYFEGNGQSVFVEDPLKLMVESYIAGLESGIKTDRDILINGITELETLVKSAHESLCVQ